MGSLRVSFLVVTTVLLIINFTNGEEAKSCKQVASEITKKQLAAMGVCGKEMKFKNGKEKASKTNCVMKCSLTAIGFLGPDSRVSSEVLEKFFKAQFGSNEELIANAKQATAKCVDVGVATIDPDEEMCKSYDPFIKCLMEIQKNMCPS